MDGLGLDEVEVVQHQHGFHRKLDQAIQQGREHSFDRWRRGGVKQRQGGLAHTRMQRIERGDDIGPEANGVVITRIKRDPGEG